MRGTVAKRIALLARLTGPPETAKRRARRGKQAWRDLPRRGRGGEVRSVRMIDQAIAYVLAERAKASEARAAAAEQAPAPEPVAPRTGWHRLVDRLFR